MLGLELDENGQHDVLNIIGTSFFDVFTEVEFHIDPDFTPTPGDTFDFINLRDPTTGDTQHLLALIITPQGGIDVGAQGDFANFDPEQITILETPVTPGQVPEPGTWILIATSLLGLAAARRRR